MTPLYFCPLWGSEELPFDLFCDHAVRAGYNGVELSLPFKAPTPTQTILQTLEKYGLKLIAQHWETMNPNIDEHKVEYQQRLEWQAAHHPLFINSQTGRDWFSFEQNQQLIDVATHVENQTGVKIIHEIHRGKFSFCAAQTQPFLNKNPTLRLTADFSHWCAVSESLLEDQTSFVDAAIKRSDHIHARVGHPEGPQITDPRAPEWSAALEAHLTWWDAIVESHSPHHPLTITPEFGPAPYMPTLPYTKQPVANQWEINVHMMNLLKKRY